MKIVCLADKSPQNDRILAALDECFDVSLIIATEYVSSKKRKRLSLVKVIKKGVEKVYFSVRSRRPISERVEGFLDDLDERQVAALQAKRVVLKSSEINEKSTQELIASHEPDYLFVSGAPILKKVIFALPKHGAVNLHYGIAPDYRGQHTLAFPFLAGDFRKLGATLHFIDEGIDTGGALAWIYPEVGAQDSLEEVEAKVTTLAAKVIVKVLADGPLPKDIQRSRKLEGQEIRYEDYGIFQDLRFMFRKKRKEKNAVLSEERIVKNF